MTDEDRLDGCKQRLEALMADSRAATATVKRERKSLKLARRRVNDADDAVSILQEVAATVQQQAHQKITTTVSRCLAAVFDDPYEFQITFERKRSKTEARISFRRDDLELDAEEGTECGVLDIAAFALRMTCVMLGRPHRRRVLILDEPFRFVSKDRGYRDRVAELLITLSEEFNLQIILVTHMHELRIGTVLDLNKPIKSKKLKLKRKAQ